MKSGTQCSLIATATPNADCLLEMLSALPSEHRAREALALSARLLEFAAFEAATHLSSANVGTLIDWAAQLEQCSATLSGPDGQSCFRASPNRPN